MTAPVGWRPRRLTDLADYINGYAFKPDDWREEGLPIVRIEQLRDPDGRFDYCDCPIPPAKIIDDGDLIFSWSATLMLRIWRYGRAALNQHLFKVVERDDVDRGFLKAFIEFHLPSLTAASHGSTMQHITRKELVRFSASVPESKAEQARIAEVLSTVDGAIERIETLIAKQRRIKVGLLHDLLARGIDEHGNIRSADAQNFKDSPLGRIPMDWVCEPLSHFVPSAEYGISSSLGDTGAPVLRMNNLSDGEADLSEIKYTTAVIPEKLWLRPGDVLFNRTNSWEHVGRTGIWRGQLRPATFASYLVRLNPHPSRLLSELLNVWLNWAPTQIRMRQFATPAVQQVNINPTNLRMMMAAFPRSLNEQEAMVQQFRRHVDAITATQRSLQKLRAIKSGLMRDLLTGGRRVTRLLDTSESILEQVS